jgi:hypothetical protein
MCASGAGSNLSLPCWISRPTAGQGDQEGTSSGQMFVPQLNAALGARVRGNRARFTAVLLTQLGEERGVSR